MWCFSYFLDHLGKNLLKWWPMRFMVECVSLVYWLSQRVARSASRWPYVYSSYILSVSVSIISTATVSLQSLLLCDRWPMWWLFKKIHYSLFLFPSLSLPHGTITGIYIESLPLSLTPFNHLPQSAPLSRVHVLDSQFALVISPAWFWTNFVCYFFATPWCRFSLLRSRNSVWVLSRVRRRQRFLHVTWATWIQLPVMEVRMY